MAFNLKSQSPLKQAEDTPYVKSRMKAKQSPSQATSFEEFGKKHPYIKAAVQILDPTGISSHGDVKKAWNDGEFNSSDIIEPMGALPVLGKFGKMIKGAKVGTDYLKVSKLSKAVKTANRVGDASTAANTPLHKQKLSPLAAKKKAARDLAYAKTDDRRIKKAHSQRMHRKYPNGKGKDWDHEDGRFESVKQNRGNEGEGTKKESGKHYKVS